MVAVAAAALILTGALDSNASVIGTTHTFTPVADAYVSSAEPGVGYGSEGVLRIDNANPTSSSTRAISYVRFDVQGLSDPATRAIVRFYATSGDNHGFDIRDMTGSSWNEDTITWENAPHLPSGIVASSGGFGAGDWAALDVTSLVHGNGSLSLAITTSSSAPIAVSSREGAAPPELVVTTSTLPPRNEVLPTISGSAQEGQSLAADPGTWFGTTPISYVYAWQRCDANGDSCAPRSVGGASYDLTASDVGATLRVAVTAANTAGSSTVESVPTAVIRPASVEQPSPGDDDPPSIPANLRVTSTTETTLEVAWDAATDNVGVTGYNVARGGVWALTVTQPIATLRDLTCDTTYAVVVDAFDAAGNRSALATVRGTTTACSGPPPPPPPPGDTTPPSRPAGFVVSASTETSVTLTWLPSTDDVGVEGYGVYRNGASVSTVTVPGKTVSGLTCGTPYTFEVDAYDAADNRSSRAAVTTSTSACVDDRPPTAPANVSIQSRAESNIELSWSASSDNIGVIGYGLYRAGSLVGTTLDTTAVFSGLTCDTDYTLAVDAFDEAGNHSQKTMLNVSTVPCADTTPPTMPSSLAASAITLVSLTLSWTASADNVGVVGYDVYRNNTKVASVAATSSSQTGLVCGTSYVFAIIARDAAGNSSQQALFNAATAPCSPPPPAEQPYFSDGFESSQPFSNWRYEPGYDPLLHLSVLGVSGSAVGLRTTPTSWGPNPISQNSNIYLYPELAHSGWSGDARALGQDTWYRVHMRFPYSFQATPGGWNWLVLWHDDNETQTHGANSFAFGIFNDSQGTRLRLRPAGGSSTSPTYGDIRLAPIVRDHWYDLVWHFVWHTSSSIGKYEMWLDGAQVASAFFPTLYMNPSGNHSYNTFDLLNYHEKASWTSEVHFDSVLIGPSAASVGFTSAGVS